MIFIVVVGLFIMAAVGGMIYLATRFRKFIPEKTREKLGKKKSFLIGFTPNIGFIVYCFFDLVNGVIVTVNVVCIFIIFELIGKIISVIINKATGTKNDPNSASGKPKSGKRFCPDSKGIPEQVIEEAFVASYKLLTADNKQVMNEFLKRMGEALGDETVQKNFDRARQEVFVVSERRKKLLEKYVDGGVEKNVYESMDRELQKKLREAEEELERAEEQLDNKESIRKRMLGFKKTLMENQSLSKFDRAVFESVVEKVIVGGYDDDGNKDPYKITFIYKNGFKDGVDRAKEKFDPKNDDSGANMCSDSDVQPENVCSDIGNDARGDGGAFNAHRRLKTNLRRILRRAGIQRNRIRKIKGEPPTGRFPWGKL